MQDGQLISQFWDQNAYAFLENIYYLHLDWTQVVTVHKGIENSKLRSAFDKLLTRWWVANNKMLTEAQKPNSFRLRKSNFELWNFTSRAQVERCLQTVPNNINVSDFLVVNYWKIHSRAYIWSWLSNLTTTKK